MSAPALNRSLVLEVAVPAPDGLGGFTEAWQARGTLWAALLPGTGGERAWAGAAVPRASYRIVVRGAALGAPSRPAAGHRLRDGSRLFRILAVVERDAAARYLTCFCEEEMAS